jgi:hypothetical protein
MNISFDHLFDGIGAGTKAFDDSANKLAGEVYENASNSLQSLENSSIGKAI